MKKHRVFLYDNLEIIGGKEHNILNLFIFDFDSDVCLIKYLNSEFIHEIRKIKIDKILK